MRTTKALSIVAGVVAILGTSVWAMPAATVVTVRGKALVRNDQMPDRPAKEIKSKDQIFPGDVINTSSNASVKLLFSDQSIIDITSSTLFKIDEYVAEKNISHRKVSLSMQFGKIRASINKPIKPPGKFQFRSKSATMGVRGTEILLGAELDSGSPGKDGPVSKVDLTVLEGKVAVSTDNQGAAEQSVEKGQAMTMSDQAPVEVKKLSDQEVLAAENLAGKFAKDTTFNQAIGAMEDDQTDKGRSPADTNSGASAVGFATMNELLKEMKSLGPVEVDLQGGIPGVFDLNFNPPVDVHHQQTANVRVGFTY